MLSSDATFWMEMFPFGHCPEGNGDVSLVCFFLNNTSSFLLNHAFSTIEMANLLPPLFLEEAWLMRHEQSHDEVYGCLKGGSGNSGGRRLAISMVEEAWLSEKEEV
ncbi:hypothetical protein Tco_1145562 [Tanacetum coccineum]